MTKQMTVAEIKDQMEKLNDIYEQITHEMSMATTRETMIELDSQLDDINEEIKFMRDELSKAQAEENIMFNYLFRVTVYISNLIESLQFFTYKLELTDIDCVLITEELNNEQFSKIIGMFDDKSVKIRLNHHKDPNPKWALSNHNRGSFI